MFFVNSCIYILLKVSDLLIFITVVNCCILECLGYSKVILKTMIISIIIVAASHSAWLTLSCIIKK